MPSESQSSADPVHQSSARELKWILVIWLVNFVWVVGYCGLQGYRSTDQPLTIVFGMPAWVFWGVFVPWIVAAAASSWFALTQMDDHELEDHSPAEPCDD